MATVNGTASRNSGEGARDDGVGPGPVITLYAVVCALLFLFPLRRVPETRGKTPEQIERELTPRAGVL